MPNVQRIGKEILFVGDAQHGANVAGPLLLEKEVVFDECCGLAIDTTSVWDNHLDGNGDTFAVAAATGGDPRIYQIVTGDGDNEETIVHLGGLQWYGADKCLVEARIRLQDVSGVCLFFGFADAVGEMSIDYKDDSLTYTADDAVGFIVDADASSSSIYCVGNAAGTPETAVDSGTDWANDEWHVLRVELSTAAAAFYLDGNPVGFMDAAITSSDPLAITIAIENRDAFADYVDIDYVYACQTRT